MAWNDLIRNIKEIFVSHDDKDWLNKLIADLEKKVIEEKNLPFRIIKIKEKGFIIKINGLFGYISFLHMPWRYSDVEFWGYVFKYLQDKTFFCKIYRFEKEPLTIIVDGDVPQFSKMSLIKDSEYEGVVVKKNRNGLYVDFGLSFNWQCGSFVQLIKKSDIDNSDYSKLKCGDTYKAFYIGESEEKVAIFQDENYINRKEFIGKMFEVKIGRNFNNRITYLVEGAYEGLLPVTKDYYPTHTNYIRKAISNLMDGETIHCEVVGVFKNGQLLQLKWIDKSEIKKALEREPIDDLSNNEVNNIQARIDDEVSEKLKMIGEVVDVEVLKFEDPNGRLTNKYIVSNKYQGDLLITNDNYHISEKEKSIIEKNFQDNEILICTVMSIEKNKAKIKWEISDYDFVRFIKND